MVRQEVVDRDYVVDVRVTQYRRRVGKATAAHQRRTLPRVHGDGFTLAAAFRTLKVFPFSSLILE